MKPLVSIVLPTYNHANLIGEAISSVINQTYSNWELIIVDNNSVDNTSEVISEFKDERIKTFKIQNNGVIASSRNMGINNSKGNWIAFIDSDDVWYSNKLELVINKINSNTKYQVFCHDEVMVNVSNNRTKKLINGPFCDNFYSNMLIYGNKLSTSSTIVSREYIISNKLLFRNHTNLITVEDYDFWLLLAKSNAKFYFIKKILGEYRIHGSNMSMVNLNFYKNLVFLIKDHVYNLQNFEKKHNKLFAVIYLRIMISQSFSFIRNKNYKSFFYQMLFLLKISPSFFLSLVFNAKNNFN